MSSWCWLKSTKNRSHLGKGTNVLALHEQKNLNRCRELNSGWPTRSQSLYCLIYLGLKFKEIESQKNSNKNAKTKLEPNQ
jgi:hypothetical protein